MNNMLLNAGTNYTVKYVYWCNQCHARFSEHDTHSHALVKTAFIAYKD